MHIISTIFFSWSNYHLDFVFFFPNEHCSEHKKEFNSRFKAQILFPPTIFLLPTRNKFNEKYFPQILVTRINLSFGSSLLTMRVTCLQSAISKTIYTQDSQFLARLVRKLCQATIMYFFISYLTSVYKCTLRQCLSLFFYLNFITRNKFENLYYGKPK